MNNHKRVIHRGKTGLVVVERSYRGLNLRVAAYPHGHPFDYPQNATSAGAAKFDNTRVI
jgi:hypothetical protein